MSPTDWHGTQQHCRADDCTRDVHGLGYCTMHYQRARKGRPLNGTYKGWRQSPVCTIDGCTKPSHSASLCGMHYARKRQGRAVDAPVPVRPTVRDEQGRKHCNTCQTWQPLNNYSQRSASPDGLHTKCRDCQRVAAVSLAYGVPITWLHEQLDAQGWRCAICANELTLTKAGCHVDHDHSDGRVRGLLCRGCNHLLGNARDDVDVLASAIRYLGKAEQLGGALRGKS